ARPRRGSRARQVPRPAPRGRRRPPDLRRDRGGPRLVWRGAREARAVSDDSPEVVKARMDAERARARLLGTFRSLEQPFLDLKQQLTPDHLMREAWQGAKEKGADLAEEAVDAVRARPLAATGVVAAIALFLAREALIELAGRGVDGVSKKRRGEKSRGARKRAEETATA